MDINNQSFHIKRACNIVGNQILLAEKLGVTPGSVSQWVNNIRPVPIDKCVAIDLLTNGEVSRKDLRSDWQKYWPELAADGVNRENDRRNRPDRRANRRSTDPQAGA